jgi:hypothetical protein
MALPNVIQGFIGLLADKKETFGNVWSSKPQIIARC